MANLDPPPPREPEASLAPWLALVPAALLTLFALNQAVGENNFQDFFIYRAGAEIGLRGESPYDTAALRDRILAQYPGQERLANNAGFFQPPGGIVVFAPFALLPYPAAKIAWALVNGLAAWAALSLLRTFANPPGSAPRPKPLIELAVGVGLCLNFLAVAILAVGQTTLLFVGCVALGQVAFEKGRPTAGTLLWAVAFVKPHIALPLLPLAWYLGGWKRMAGLTLAVGALTLLGCQIAGGSPLFLREYFDFLATSHKTVESNRADINTQITSWNRIVNAAAEGKLVIELNAVTTLAGYAVWYGFVLGRCALVGLWPSPAWALAASAAGALVFCQVLGYEVFLLALLIPYLRDLFMAGRRAPAVALLTLIAVQLAPFDFESSRWPIVQSFLQAPRALPVAGVALLVLFAKSE